MEGFPENTPGVENFYLGVGGYSIEVCLQWPETFRRTVDFLLFNNFRTNPAVPDFVIRILAVDEKNATVSLEEYFRLDPGIINRIHWVCPLFRCREVFEYLQRNRCGLDHIYFEGRPGFLLVYNLLRRRFSFSPNKTGASIFIFRN